MLLLLASLITEGAVAGVRYERLLSFDCVPLAELIEGKDGALYGTTQSCLTNDAGTVFKLNKDSTGLRTLHRLLHNPFAGERPTAGLVQGADGALYGTTASGGASGAGIVFRISNDGQDYRILYSFKTNGMDAQSPYGRLCQGSDGLLYGTTWGGGVSNWGTVFKLNTNGADYALLHSFCATPDDGANPLGGVIEGADGVLYGATSSGGAAGFFGTVFGINKDGMGYKVLHSFDGSDGDAVAYSAPIEASDGALYGATINADFAQGTLVFRLNEDGSEYTVLLNLSTSAPYYPGDASKLVEGLDGALYGTTSEGGSNRFGTVFTIDRDGSRFTILHHFNGDNGDGTPRSGLLQASDGAFYGTSVYSGDMGGSVFRVWPRQTPEITAIVRATDCVQLSIAGTAGSNYRVQRSTDLTNWSVLETLTMPPAGIYTNLDNKPPRAAAFYRAAWLP